MATAGIKCSSCGVVSEGGTFCMSCGEVLKAEEPSKAPEPASSAASPSTQPEPSTKPTTAFAPSPPPTPAPPPAPVSRAAHLIAPPPAPVSRAESLASAASSAWTSGGSQSITSLGTLVDSWSDLLDGMSEKKPLVAQSFRERMGVRALPNVDLSTATISPPGLGRTARDYHLVKTRTGATMAVRIDQYGRDLFLSWDMWVRPIINIKVVLGVGGLAALLALNNSQTPVVFGAPQFSPIMWIIFTILNCLWIGFLVGLAGKIVKGSWLGFVIEEITPFDVDDVTALTLAVHHSLLQAADAAGIAATDIRAKETFRGGQRNRII